MTFWRPTRSASTANGTATMMPARTTAPGDAEADVADTEVVGGELGGLGEERVRERRRHRGGGEEAQDERLPLVDPIGRRPPRWCRSGRAG